MRAEPILEVTFRCTNLEDFRKLRMFITLIEKQASFNYYNWAERKDVTVETVIESARIV